MYRVLIVDDEYLSRFVLKTIVSKKISNVEIAGEAENGRQAIEMNRELKPDIIIMDIKMPGINGIEATKEILKEFPNISVLILTAYDNFEYVKTALDIGVKGYILKPVKEEEVVEKVDKIINEIDKRVNRLGLEEQIENKIKVVRPLVQNELISSLISANFDIEKTGNYAKFLQIEIKSGYFMLISPGQMFSKSIDDSIRNRIIKDKIADIAEKHLPLMKRCFFANSSGNTIIAYFPADSNNAVNDTGKEALIIGEEIKNRIKVIAHIDVAVGIGNVYAGIENQNKSYNEASIALRKALRDKSVVQFGMMNGEEASDIQPQYPFELESKLIDLIKIGNMEKSGELVDEMIHYILNSNFHIEGKKESLTEFITVLKRTALKIGINPGPAAGYESIMELSGLTSIEEINEWCKRCIHSFIDLIGNKAIKSKEVINKVFEHINKNFNRDITLESVASDVGLSPQYLSKLFKESYGSNFIDCVTGKRMEYARGLLLQSDINIKEVSKAAGYGDTNYFCKIFKKDTGYTPKQYRAQNRDRI